MDVNADLDRVEMTTRSATGSILSLPLLLGALMLVFILGGAAGYLFRDSQAPAIDSVDAGFARDMSIHHEQAVQMATLIMDRTDDQAIKSLAYDILTTQQGQIGIMSGWLDVWDLPWTSAGPRMTWMGMSVDGLMPGMATPEQLASLREAHGPAADVIFLELMIPHHRAGVEMAQYALDHAGAAPVRSLAQGIVDAQALEIEYMQELLAAKGQPSLPDASTGESNSHDH
jgi:uncharacterized protein (DUF305 family)